MDRAASIKFKLMPDGHIRGVQTHRPDLASASESMIYMPDGLSPAITAAHAPKLLMTDERLHAALLRATAAEI